MPTGFPQVDDLPVAGCRFSSVPTTGQQYELGLFATRAIVLGLVEPVGSVKGLADRGCGHWGD